MSKIRSPKIGRRVAPTPYDRWRPVENAFDGPPPHEAGQLKASWRSSTGRRRTETDVSRSSRLSWGRACGATAVATCTVDACYYMYVRPGVFPLPQGTCSVQECVRLLRRSSSQTSQGSLKRAVEGISSLVVEGEWRRGLFSTAKERARARV